MGRWGGVEGVHARAPEANTGRVEERGMGEAGAEGDDGVGDAIK